MSMGAFCSHSDPLPDAATNVGGRVSRLVVTGDVVGSEIEIETETETETKEEDVVEDLSMMKVPIGLLWRDPINRRPFEAGVERDLFWSRSQGPVKYVVERKFSCVLFAFVHGKNMFERLEREINSNTSRIHWCIHHSFSNGRGTVWAVAVCDSDCTARRVRKQLFAMTFAVSDRREHDDEHDDEHDEHKPLEMEHCFLLSPASPTLLAKYDRTPAMRASKRDTSRIVAGNLGRIANVCYGPCVGAGYDEDLIFFDDHDVLSTAAAVAEAETDVASTVMKTAHVKISHRDVISKNYGPAVMQMMEQGVLSHSIVDICDAVSRMHSEKVPNIYWPCKECPLAHVKFTWTDTQGRVHRC